MNTKINTITSPLSTEGMYQFTPSATVWLSLERLLASLQGVERDRLKIVFCHTVESVTPFTRGIFILSIDSKVLLMVEGSFEECEKLAEAFDFGSCKEDDFTGHSPHARPEGATAPKLSEIPRKCTSEPIAIALESFEAFSTGGEIEHSVSAKLEPKAGDRIGWECGCNISGTLEVLAVGETDRGFVSCTLRRVS